MQHRTKALVLAGAVSALLGAPALAGSDPGACRIPRDHYDKFLQKGLFYREQDGVIYYQVYGDRSTKWIIGGYQNPCFAKYRIALYPAP